MNALRTLEVSSPAIPTVLGRPALEAVRISGKEGINSLFEYELLLKTPDALNLDASGALDFDLDSFVGRELSCVIQLEGSGALLSGATGAATDAADAGERQINALITHAALWGEEGRFAQYVLTLRPWLYLGTLRADCKVFQNQTVVETLDELLGAYTFPVEKRLFGTYPPRDYQTQFNETDFQFLSRLCEEWGINYHHEHSDGKHRLVLSDTNVAFREAQSAAYREVAYHAPGWKTDAEYLHHVVPLHRLTAGRYTTSDYDYARPRADLGASRADPRPTGMADAEVYQWHAAHGGSHYAQPRAGSTEPNDPREEAREFALRRMQAARGKGERAVARGNLRGMAAGHAFRLCNHPRQVANVDYLIVEAEFQIENNARDSQSPDAHRERKQQWRVETALTLQPIAVPLRPEPIRRKPSTGGPQVALVVGPAGQNLWTDALGRIKVQFPWDRVGEKNQHSSCWVRVSSPIAGNQLGDHHLPRIGQEVIIDFIGGDPDLPVCKGRVHNQLNQPPWQLPAQSALSGWRSRELMAGAGNASGGRSNHLLLDDTHQQIQAQLKSDHLSSSISLGHIARVNDNAGRLDPRGPGAELHTDGHGAIRAGRGLLITSEGRERARGHMLDIAETGRRLDGASSLHESAADLAQKCKAQSEAEQMQVARALHEQNGDLKGQGVADPQLGRFPEFTAPHLVLASPAGIEATSRYSTHFASGEDHALSSVKHTSVLSQGSVLATALKALKLVAAQQGIKLSSDLEDIDIQALSANISLFAKDRITLKADKISLVATTELAMIGGGSFATLLSGSLTEGSAGAWVEHAGTHSMVGPDNLPAPPMPPHEDVKLTDHLVFALASHATGGRPMANEPYTLFKGGAEVKKDVTDEFGQVHIKHVPGTPAYRVALSNGAIFELQVHPRFVSAKSAALLPFVGRLRTLPAIATSGDGYERREDCPDTAPALERTGMEGRARPI